MECLNYFLEIPCNVETVVYKIAIRVSINSFNVVLLEITLN